MSSPMRPPDDEGAGPSLSLSMNIAPSDVQSEQSSGHHAGSFNPSYDTTLLQQYVGIPQASDIDSSTPSQSSSTPLGFRARLLRAGVKNVPIQLATPFAAALRALAPSHGRTSGVSEHQAASSESVGPFASSSAATLRSESLQLPTSPAGAAAPQEPILPLPPFVLPPLESTAEMIRSELGDNVLPCEEAVSTAGATASALPADIAAAVAPETPTPEEALNEAVATTLEELAKRRSMLYSDYYLTYTFIAFIQQVELGIPPLDELVELLAAIPAADAEHLSTTIKTRADSLTGDSSEEQDFDAFLAFTLAQALEYFLPSGQAVAPTPTPIDTPQIDTPQQPQPQPQLPQPPQPPPQPSLQPQPQPKPSTPALTAAQEAAEISRLMLQYPMLSSPLQHVLGYVVTTKEQGALNACLLVVRALTEASATDLKINLFRVAQSAVAHARRLPSVAFASHWATAHAELTALARAAAEKEQQMQQIAQQQQSAYALAFASLLTPSLAAASAPPSIMGASASPPSGGLDPSQSYPYNWPLTLQTPHLQLLSGYPTPQQAPPPAPQPSLPSFTPLRPQPSPLLPLLPPQPQLPPPPLPPQPQPQPPPFFTPQPPQPPPPQQPPQPPQPPPPQQPPPSPSQVPPSSPYSSQFTGRPLTVLDRPEPSWWGSPLPFGVTCNALRLMPSWQQSVDDAPADKASIKAGCPVTARSLADRLNTVSDAQSYAAIRSTHYSDVGDWLNFHYSLGWSSNKTNKQAIQLLAETASMVPAMRRTCEELTLLLSDHPNEGGLGRALTLGDTVWITPDLGTMSNPWDKLKYNEGMTPLELLHSIHIAMTRIASTSPKTDSDVVCKFRDLIKLAAEDPRFEPSTIEPVRKEILSPTGVKSYVTCEQLQSVLTFHNFPALQVKSKRALGAYIAWDKDMPAPVNVTGLSAEPRTIVETPGGGGGDASQRDRLDFKPGSVGLKHWGRIVTLGLFGANNKPNEWVLNPARLKTKDASGKNVNDGKVASLCSCCGEPPPIGVVSDPTAVIAWGYTQWVKQHGDIGPANSPAPNNIILHFECWCHRGHRAVLKYIKEHPDLDCSWMTETYTPTEWNKILVDAGVKK